MEVEVLEQEEGEVTEFSSPTSLNPDDPSINLIVAYKDGSSIVGKGDSLRIRDCPNVVEWEKSQAFMALAS